MLYRYLSPIESNLVDPEYIGFSTDKRKTKYGS